MGYHLSGRNGGRRGGGVCLCGFVSAARGGSVAHSACQLPFLDRACAGRGGAFMRAENNGRPVGALFSEDRRVFQFLPSRLTVASGRDIYRRGHSASVFPPPLPFPERRVACHAFCCSEKCDRVRVSSLPDLPLRKGVAVP